MFFILNAYLHKFAKVKHMGKNNFMNWKYSQESTAALQNKDLAKKTEASPFIFKMPFY